MALFSSTSRVLPKTAGALGLTAAWSLSAYYSSSPSSSLSASSKKTVRVALCQVPVTPNKEENIKVTRKYIREAVKNGAEIVVLPEIWNSPYATSAFPKYAEAIPDVVVNAETVSRNGQNKMSTFTGTCEMLSEEAKKGNILLIGIHVT
jgi:hypothetical protein